MTPPIRPVMISALALAACSSQTPPDNGATPAATPSAATPAASSTSAAMTDSHTSPKPGALKTFGDWAVGCDNGLVCTMASLLPGDSVGEGATLNLTRDPGPDGRYHADLGEGVTDAKRRTGAAHYTVDGRDLGSDADALAAAMANGQVLKVPDGTISLKGASAALRYIDAMQGRAGTVTATVAKGSKPAGDVPPAPALPVVKAALLSLHSAALPAAVIATMNRIGQCELMDGMDGTPSVVGTPGGRLLAVLPCSAGAYNVIGALFVIDGSTVTPAQVDAPSGFEETGADAQTPVHSVINGDFDGKALTSYAKGRGLGDCGSMQRFAWDGARYRLVEQADMGECRGNPNYITTWRARTVAP
jgi:hypothetical protein